MRRHRAVDARAIGAPPTRVRRSTVRASCTICGTPLVPSKLGPARRNHHIVDLLSRFYDVSVLAVGSADDARTFLRSCSRVSYAVFVRARLNTRMKFVYKAWQTALERCDFLPALEPELREGCARLTTGGPSDAIVLSSGSHGTPAAALRRAGRG